ncbi:MSS4 [Sanghuangporus sanghuang]
MAGAVAGPSRASPVPDVIDSRRTSGISGSAASYHTAFSDNSPSPSSMNLTASSGSVHTVGAAGKRGDTQEANPMHLPSQGNQEVHVVKVETESVELRAGPTPDSIVARAGKTLAHVITTEPAVMAAGPPPPSPPPSVEHEDDMSMTERSPSPKLGMSRSEPSQPQVSSSTRSTRNRSFDASTAGASNDILRQRPSTETRFSSLSVSGTGAMFIAPSSVRTVPTDEPSTPSTCERPPTVSTSGSPHLAHASKTSHVSIDGHLQPPPSTTHRPARRNTTGSAAPIMSSRGSQATLYAYNHGHLPHHRGVAVDDTDAYTAAHSAAQAQMLGLTPGPDGTLGFGELDPDILIQADQIRRERTAKRRHQEQQEAEMAALNKAADEKKVLMGNLIGEGHVNYVLMYNMLTGIRIAVSRCQAKPKRRLTEEDFTARHKYSFDIVGNELTPSAKYDFKFKDYAPWVFRELRETHFGLDPADYLLSLTEKYILSELGSPGKSGSFFYFSRDYRFIIKTIHHTEHKFLRKILKEYYEHVKLNPHTLLSRFYGLHRVKLPRGRKIHFVIMNNLFPPHKDIHETYDLKGSTVGREYPEEKAQKNPRAVLKDLNWINRGKSLELGPEKRALLAEQLRRDSGLLKRLNVMDYSLLVGIHNMQRGNRDMVRKKTLKVFSPPPLPAVKRKPTSLKGSSPEAIAMRKAMRRSAPEGLGTSKALDLPEEDTGDRQQFIFYQDDGGLQATDEQNQPMDTIYYLGVIDILTPYNTLKRAEHIWKGLSADRHKISPVPPEEYGDRFFEFLTSVMRGGGGAEKFKPE